MNRRSLLMTFAATGLAGCALPAMATPPVRSLEGELRVSLLGQALIEHAPTSAEWPGREAIASHLARADVVFSNLETVIVGPNAGAPTRDLLTLHAGGPELLDSLKSVHINLLATSNNHAFDLGTGGIIDTLAALREAGLPTAGTGETLALASRPAAVSTPAGTTAVVGFATGRIRPGGAATDQRAGVNELRRDADGQPDAEDLARILGAIAVARREADVVLAYHHNHDWEPDPVNVPDWQRVLARQCIEAGASAFVGHGVPRLQGIEFYQGSPIFYGLGNFIFQTEKVVGAYGPESWEGVIVDCTFRDGRFAGATLVPLRMNEIGQNGPEDMATRGFPRLADRSEFTATLEVIAAASHVLGNGVGISSGGILTAH